MGDIEDLLKPRLDGESEVSCRIRHLKAKICMNSWLIWEPHPAVDGDAVRALIDKSLDELIELKKLV